VKPNGMRGRLFRMVAITTVVGGDVYGMGDLHYQGGEMDPVS
jgi:hypothetical protein